VFRGTVALSELQPEEGFHLVVNGRGPSGVIEGQGDVRLEESAGGTAFYYAGSGQISGRMASVGQRVMTSSAKAIIKQSLENLDNQVHARSRPQQVVAEDAVADGAPRPADVPRADSAPPPPSQSDFMLGVAENMLEEFVPNPQHRKYLAWTAGASVLFLVFNIFANMVARRVVKNLKASSRE
jgi:hypothetical protein